MWTRKAILTMLLSLLMLNSSLTWRSVNLNLSRGKLSLLGQSLPRLINWPKICFNLTHPCLAPSKSDNHNCITLLCLIDDDFSTQCLVFLFINFSFPSSRFSEQIESNSFCNSTSVRQLFHDKHVFESYTRGICFHNLFGETFQLIVSIFHHHVISVWVFCFPLWIRSKA